MPSNSDLVFGKLAVKNKFLTEAQLGEVIRKQGELESVGISQSLPHLLAERGYLTLQKIEHLLKLQNYVELREDDKRFGAIALKSGFATEENIHEGLTIQFEFFQQGVQPLPRLGELLVQKGYISEQQRESILRMQTQGAKAASPPPAQPGAFETLLAGESAPTNVCLVCGKPNPPSAQVCTTCGTALAKPPSARVVSAPTPVKKQLRAAQLEATLFGKIALEEQLVPKHQLDECLAIQTDLRAKGIPRKIGQILTGKGYMSAAQVDRVLGLQAARRGQFELADAGAEKFYSPPVPDDVAPRRPLPRPIEVMERGKVVKYHPKILFFKFVDNLTSLAWLGVIVAAGVIAVFAVPFLWRAIFSPREQVRELAKDPNKELVKVQTYEEDSAATGSFDEIREKYKQFVGNFPGTDAAKKATKRIEELDSLYREAEQKFKQARASTEVLKNAERAEEAYVLWDDLIKFLDEVPGRPFKGDAHRLKTDALTAAVSKVNDVIAKARQAARDGDMEKADAICAAAKSGKLWELAPEVRTLIGVLEDELAVLAQKKRREDAEKTARDEARRQKTEKYKTLVIEGRGKEADHKLAEAACLYAKALAIAVGQEEIASAKADHRRVAETITEDCRTLKTKLQLVKNCCLSKLVSEAIEKCKPLAENPRYADFGEDLSKLIEDLKNARTDPSLASAVGKGIDNLAKRIQEWADAALLSPPDMRCSKCQGSGSVVCVKCAGVGRIQDQRCPDCAQVAGQRKCDKCIEGFAKCGKCKGHGKMQQVQWTNKACPLCRGSGYFGGLSCAQCKGGGAIREGKLLGLVICEFCKGTGKSSKDCPDCEKGYGKCIRCDGTGYIGKVCEQCAGLGKVSCAECNGSGIDPALVE